MQNRTTGTVKWFDPGKGYGFVLARDGRDLFVHSSALPPGEVLAEGDQIEFGIEQGVKGLSATQINVLTRSGMAPRSAAPRSNSSWGGGSWAPETLGELKRGTVRRYDIERGFGFIRMDGTDVDLFVHRSAAGRDLHVGEVVEFRVGQGQKGPRAEQVSVLDSVR
jgi:CspA family cold shock protein